MAEPQDPQQKPRDADWLQALDDATWRAAQEKPKGFGETIGFKLPFVSSIGEGIDIGKVIAAKGRYDDGTADDEDIFRLKHFALDQARESTFWGNVGGILAELPAFAGEVAVTGGLYTAGRKVGTRAATEGVKKLVKLGIEREALSGIERAVIKGGARVAGIGTGAVIQTLAMPNRIVTTTMEKMLPNMGLSTDEAGHVALSFEGTSEDFLGALPKGLADSFIEVFSERTGGVANHVPGMAKLRSLQTVVMKDWLKIHPNEGVAGFLGEIRKKAGWNGVLGEVLEERIGSAMKAATPGLPETWDQVFPGWKQLAAETVAFAAPSLLGVAAHKAAGLRRPKDDLEDEAATVEAETAQEQQPSDFLREADKAAEEAPPAEEPPAVAPPMEEAQDEEEAPPAPAEAEAPPVVPAEPEPSLEMTAPEEPPVPIVEPPPPAAPAPKPYEAPAKDASGERRFGMGRDYARSEYGKTDPNMESMLGELPPKEEELRRLEQQVHDTQKALMLPPGPGRAAALHEARTHGGFAGNTIDQIAESALFTHGYATQRGHENALTPAEIRDAVKRGADRASGMPPPATAPAQPAAEPAKAPTKATAKAPAEPVASVSERFAAGARWPATVDFTSQAGNGKYVTEPRAVEQTDGASQVKQYEELKDPADKAKFAYEAIGSEEGRPTGFLRALVEALERNDKVTRIPWNKLPPRIRLDRGETGWVMRHLPRAYDERSVSVPKVKPKDPVAAARSHQADSTGRYAMNGVFVDPAQGVVVATDGRRLVIIPHKTEGAPRVIDEYDKVLKDSSGKDLEGKNATDNFPRYAAVVPVAEKLDMQPLDAERVRKSSELLRRVKRAIDTETQPLTIFGSGKKRIAVNSEYLRDAVEALVASGAKSLTYGFRDSTAPLLIQGDNGAKAVVMPITLEDAARDEVREEKGGLHYHFGSPIQEALSTGKGLEPVAPAAKPAAEPVVEPVVVKKSRRGKKPESQPIPQPGQETTPPPPAKMPKLLVPEAVERYFQITEELIALQADIDQRLNDFASWKAKGDALVEEAANLMRDPAVDKAVSERNAAERKAKGEAKRRAEAEAAEADERRYEESKAINEKITDFADEEFDDPSGEDQAAAFEELLKASEGMPPAEFLALTNAQMRELLVSRAKARKDRKGAKMPIEQDDQAVAVNVALPKDLAGAKPRFGYRERNFTVAFASDIDKAMYIVTQEKKSKADNKYYQWLKGLGFSDGDIESHGARVKESVKREAASVYKNNALAEMNKRPAKSGVAIPPIITLQERTGFGDEAIEGAPEKPADPDDAEGVQDADEEVPTGAAEESPAPDPLTNAPRQIRVSGDTMRRIVRAMERIPGLRQKKPLTSWVDVQAAIMAALNVVDMDPGLREGRLVLRKKSRNIIGEFNYKRHTIAVVNANDIGTLAHEAGHALDTAIWRTGGRTKAGLRLPGTQGTNIQKELVAGGRKLYGKQKPAGGYASEGWAEFVRFYFSDRKEAAKNFPETFAFFEKWLNENNKPLGEALDVATEVYARYMAQSDADKVASTIVDPSSLKANMTRRAAGISRFFSAAAHVEMAHPIFQFSRFARKALERRGELLPPSMDPEAVLTAYRGTHEAVMETMQREGTVDPYGRRTGISLLEALAPAKGQYTLLTSYLFAKRAAAIWDHSGKNPGIDAETAKRLVARIEAEHPEIALSASNMYAWWDRVNAYCAALSPHYEEILKSVEARDPGFYVPLHREFDEWLRAWTAGGRGVPLTSGNIVKRLHGSGYRVIDPLQSILKDGSARIAAAQRRRVVDLLFNLGDRVEGMGRIFTEVPRNNIPAYQATIRTITEQLKAKLRELGGDVEIDYGEAPAEAAETAREEGGDPKAAAEAAIDALANETVTFYMQEMRAPDGKPIIARYERQPNGKTLVRFYLVNGEMYAALRSMDVYRLPHWLEATLGRSRNLFTLGTVVRAGYGLITNPIRDLQSLWINTRSHANAFQITKEWLQAITAYALHTFSGGKLTPRSYRPIIEAWLNMGLHSTTFFGQDINRIGRSSRELVSGKKFILLDPRRGWEVFKEALQFPEAGSRLAEFRLLFEENRGKGPFNLGESPLSDPDAVITMAVASKQATIDFTAAGEYGRAINRIIPFYNASIQGPRATLQAMLRAKDGRKLGAWILRGLSRLAMPTLLLWWLNRDEKWYEEMPIHEKFSFWHVTFGKDEVLRIPRGQFETQLFGSVFEALMDAAYRQDPQSVTDWFKNFIDVATPPVLPPIMSEALEQAANRDFYSDRPLVPRGEVDAPLAEQYNEHTTRASVAMARILNEHAAWIKNMPLGMGQVLLSPRRMDHAIRSTFGGLSMDLLRTAGVGPTHSAWDEASDMPAIGVLFQRGGTAGMESKSIDQMYDLLQPMIERSRSRLQEETADQKTRRLQLQDAARAVSAISYLRSVAPDAGARRDLQREAVSIAAGAVAAELSGKNMRGPMHGSALRWDYMKKRAEAEQKDRVKYGSL